MNKSYEQFNNIVKNHGYDIFYIEDYPKYTSKENLIHNINNFIKRRNCKTIATSFYYKENVISYESKSNVTIKYICECGEPFESTLSSFCGGKITCDVCSKSISKIELLTRNFLKELNIQYVEQKNF